MPKFLKSWQIYPLQFIVVHRFHEGQERRTPVLALRWVAFMVPNIFWLDISQYPNGQANVVKCTTGTDIQSGIVSRVLASGARQVGGRTGNIPPTHRNGVHVLPTGDHLPCGSLWRHQLHLGLGHLVIGDAPQWPGIILDLNGKKGWNFNKELGKIDRNWQQIL